MPDLSPRLTVRHWRSQYLVPPAHEAPGRVRARLDDAIVRDMSRALSHAIGAAVALDAPDVVFIRRLRLDLALDAAWDRDVIARAAAAALTRALVRALTEDDGANVVRFRSSAEHLAAYLIERAVGVGPSSWFFAAFDGWSVLPASQGIRAAVTDDPELGRSALAALGPPALLDVAACLTVEDARLIVERLAPRSQDAAGFLTGVGRLVRNFVNDPPPPRIVMADGLAVWLLARTPPQSSRTLLTTAAVIHLLASQALRTVAPVDRLIATLADHPDLTDRLAAAIASSHEHDIGRVLNTVGRLALAAAGPAERLRRTTRFGGVFFLLDDLADVDVERATEGWPDLDGAAPIPVVRLLILAHAVCGADWPRAFADPYWRDTFGLAGGTSVRDVARWLSERTAADARAFQQAIGRAPRAPRTRAATTGANALPGRWPRLFSHAARRILRAFSRRLPGFAASSDEYIRQTMLAVTAHVEPDGERVVVATSRAPLDLVLVRSGRNRGERYWPWLDVRPFLFVRGD